MGKNLSEMSKELETIGASYDVADLPEKLTKVEEAKAEIEAEMMKRVSLSIEFFSKQKKSHKKPY